MKILNLLHTSRWTGMADPVLRICWALKKAGPDVDLAAIPGGGLEEQAIKHNFPLCKDFYFLKKKGVRKFFSEIKQLIKALKKNNYDLINVHTNYDHIIAIMATPWVANPPIIVRNIHNLFPKYWDPITKWLLTFMSDHIITVSKGSKDYLIKTKLAKEEKITVIPGGFNSEFFVRSSLTEKEIKEQLGIPEYARLIGFPGHLHPWRGQEIVLSLLPYLKTKFSAVKLLLLGGCDHPYRDEIEKMIINSGLTGDIFFTGEDWRQGLPWLDLLNLCEIICYLTVGSDASSRALLEAMSLGKPIIAADINPLNEIIEPQVNGFLVNPNNSQEIYEAMIKLLEDKDQALSLGQQAKKTLETKFTDEIRCQKTRDLFERLIANFQSQARP